MNIRALWLLLVCCGLAHADDQADREQIQKKRETIEAQHAQREQACRQQFVVTPCLEKARTDKQNALRPLSVQEQALDEAKRRERAQAQVQRLSEKAQAAQERDKPELPQPPKAPQVAEPKAIRPSSPKASAPDRSAIEKRQREAFEARQREIQAHREMVEKRNAERAAKKAPVPLPLPASAGLR